MKKSFLVLPLAVLLAACNSNTPAPVVSADGAEISPVQPAFGNAQGGWQGEIQSAPMPVGMSSFPVVQPAPQPVYQPPVQPQPQIQPTPTAQPKPAAVKKPVPQDFTIPRDDKNLPIYSQIDKGFYNGDSYTVRKGDTMFLIAYIAGKDVREIAALNNMSEPYQLRVGQSIKLSNGSSSNTSAPSSVQSTTVAPPVPPSVTYTPAANGTAYGSDGTITGPVKAGVGVPSASGGVHAPVSQTPVAMPTITATTVQVAPQATMVSSAVKWQWPTQGRVISSFSAADGGNKGIDIAGSKGQAVKAAAAGRIVYAGNALQGYGNLIIIKHNDDFLSAYAHNDSINVEEQDNVKAGQTIATLGSTGTNSNKLHFEIRYQGKSVDPLRYLPRQ